MEEKIKRINELYNKSKQQKLTMQELEEQKTLREEYVKSFRSGFKKQLENIDIKYEDGETIPLTDFKKAKERDK